MSIPWKKWVATYAVALLVGLYTVLVADCFWNWLGVPVLRVPPISFAQAFCAMFLIGLFTRKGFPLSIGGDVTILKTVQHGLDLCIPVEKREDWTDFLNDHGLVMMDSLGQVLGAVCWNTVLLALAFAIHLVLK